MRKLCRTALLLVLFLVSVLCAEAQQRQLKGRITDQSGQPLSSVTIKVKENNASAVTENDGTFTINAPASSTTLQFTSIGYASQEVLIGNQSEFSIRMQTSATEMTDVVVVGYGTSRKKDLTGAVGTIKSAQLTQVGTADVVQAMQGRVSGVQVVSNSGEPGAGSKILIRGIGSVNGSNPIYVVDGYQTGNIGFLAPGDIESIDVLKDASATAIYGSRGANGVVLITTKKGKRGPVRFTLDSYAGVQQVRRTIPMLNASRFATLVLEGYENDGTVLPETSDLYNRLNFVKNGGYRGTDWQDEVLQDGVIQNHSLTVTGGNDQNRFRISGTYFNQTGIVKNTGLKKYFLNFSNDLTLNKWLTAGISAAYTQDEKNWYNSDLYGGVLTNALKADPLTPAWDKITNNWGRPDISYANNAARIVNELKTNKGYNRMLVGNVWAQAQIIKGLTFRTQVATDINNYHNKSYAPKFFIATDEARDRSSLWERRGESINWAWTNYLTYTQTIGDHTFSAMLGREVQESKGNNFAATAYDVPEDADLRYISSSQSTEYTVTSGQGESALLSTFGRLNYNFKDRYLLTATLRNDQSSKFFEDYRSDYNPSFALAWILSQENFLENSLGTISFLKLRAGWGRVGNEQSAGSYDIYTQVGGNNIYVFDDKIVQGFAPTRLSNPELRWEVNQQANIGIDVNFFKNKLSLTADYFDRRTERMIVAVPIPGYVGAGAPRVNAGTMQNKGFEFTANYRDQIGAFTYSLNANVSMIKNKVTSLGGGAPTDGGYVDKLGNSTRTEVGMPFPYFYGLSTDGIFNSQDELDAHRNKDNAAIQPNARVGDVKFIDVNADGKIDDLDRIQLGSPYPPFAFGFNVDLGYKGFDLRFFIQGVQGNELVNAMHYSTRNVSNSGGGWLSMEDVRWNRWTPSMPNNNEPRMTSKDPNNNMRFSDRYVEDGSYVRLKNVQIGYSLPASLLKRVGVGSSRLYLAADNLATITKYTGYDPEVSDYYYNPYSNGVDVGTYPQSKTYRAGITMNF